MRHSSLVSLRFCVLTSLGLLHACGGRSAGSSDRMQATDVQPPPGAPNTDGPNPNTDGPNTDDTDPNTDEPNTDDTDPNTDEPNTDEPTTDDTEPVTEGPDPEFSCDGEVPVGPGLVECPNGVVHRTSRPTCETELPRPERITLPAVITDRIIDAGVPASGEDSSLLLPIVYYDESSSINYSYQCLDDEDCNERPYGMCVPYRDEFESRPAVPHASDHTGSYCNYRCAEDSDCGDGFVCECGPLAGTCLRANCATEDDCDVGQACARYSYDDGCGRSNGYACTTPLDECRTNAECADECWFEQDHRFCGSVTCQVGRPFLVNGELRTATLVERRDWGAASSPSRPDDAALTREEQVRLAAEWRQIGLMEHASIAAFARFTLELLALGAPAELVEETQRAMADETRHAKLAFALAKRFGGENLGPGPLDLGGALTVGELERAVLDTVVEGCIGETTAALEAQLALENTRCPEVRAVLETIARDEQRHAELAWRFVDWALSNHPELAPEVTALVAHEHQRVNAELAARRHTVTQNDPAQRALTAHGILSARERLALREQVLTEVVSPCISALCARAVLTPPRDQTRVRTTSPDSLNQHA